MPEYKVYDEVWIMQCNTPTKMLVFAVIESMNFNKQGVDTYLKLVHSRIGAGWGNNEGIHMAIDDVAASREELINKL